MREINFLPKQKLPWPPARYPVCDAVATLFPTNTE